MLTPIADLPADVDGVSAEGTVTSDDYRRILKPLLAEARRTRDKARLLYHLGPKFERFTGGAVWQDLRLGLEHLHDFERCAVVSDKRWVRAASKLAGAMVPCEVRTYPEEDWDEAVAWLAADPERTALSFKLLPESDVLLIEPNGPVSAKDFEEMREVVDTWVEADGEVRAMVISAKDLSTWRDPSAVLRQWHLLEDHRSDIDRVAVAVGGKTGDLMSSIASQFSDAEVKRFEPDQRADAIYWAAGTEPRHRLLF